MAVAADGEIFIFKRLQHIPISVVYVLSPDAVYTDVFCIYRIIDRQAGEAQTRRTSVSAVHTDRDTAAYGADKRFSSACFCI